MRKNFGAKAFSYPQPVFIIATYNEDGSADAMNAAWGGISDTTELSVCLCEGHKTVKNLLRTGAFTVSMGDAKHVAACDYVGIASGNNTCLISIRCFSPFLFINSFCFFLILRFFDVCRLHGLDIFRADLFCRT